MSVSAETPQDRKQITLWESLLSLTLIAAAMELLRLVVQSQHVDLYEFLMPSGASLVAESYAFVCAIGTAAALPVGRLLCSSRSKTIVLARSGLVVSATLWTCWLFFLNGLFFFLGGGSI